MTTARFLALILLGNTLVQAEEVRVAVASNFTAPMMLIEKAFERETGHQLTAAYGSSGSFYAQILNGAPYEVLLSADQAIPDALLEARQGVVDSRFTYAVGALVLWSANPDLVQEGADVLTRGDFNRLAVANPELAPYGGAAMEVLQELGIEDELRARLVMGENISQTYQFVRSGNADLGLVALSQVSGDTGGSLWVVPRDFYALILQDALILQRGEQNPAAWALIDFLRSAQAAEIIRAHGYLLLASD